MDFGKFFQTLLSNIPMMIAVILCVLLLAFFIVLVVLATKEKKKLKEVMGRRAKTKAAYAGEALARKAMERAEAQKRVKEEAEAAALVEETVDDPVVEESAPVDEIVEESAPVEEPVEESKPVEDAVDSTESVVDKVAEPVVVSSDDEDDENGLNKFVARYKKSFLARLIQSTDETKSYYSDIKNAMLSYKKTNSRISWHFDTINSGRNKLLKFAVRGKTLMLYLALDANEYADTKYALEAVEGQKYEETPALCKITSDRKAKYAIELVAIVAEKFGLVKGKEDKNDDYRLPYESTETLLERGLIREISRDKWEIHKRGTAFYYIMRTVDGKILATSENYTTKEGCRNGIATLKRNLQSGEGFRIDEDKNNNFSFKITATGGRIVCVGESYKEYNEAMASYKALKKCADMADIVDLVAQDEAKCEVVEEIIIDTNSVERSEMVGKWEIVDFNDKYTVVLKASNGVIIMKGEPRVSVDSCYDYIETIKKNIVQGSLKIDSDQNGQYRYKLYNAQERIICVGENYSSKDSAISAAESLVRFAQDANVVNVTAEYVTKA